MIPFPESIQSDYEITDAVEDAIYTAERISGTVAGNVRFADPQAFTLREIEASGGLFQIGDLGFRVGSNELTGPLEDIIPQRGDTITRPDGSVFLIIAEPSQDNFLISWLCPGRKQR